MRDDLLVGDLKEKVKKVRNSLEGLIASLDPHVKPRGHAYGSDSRFDDSKDPEPPPWQGEWDNHKGPD